MFINFLKLSPFKICFLLLDIALLALLIGSEDKKPHLFLEISVSAPNVKRINKPVVFKIDRTMLAHHSNGQINVVEINGAGEVIDRDVLAQFDHGVEGEPISDELIFIMEGETPASETRKYRVRFEPGPVTSRETTRLVQVDDYGPYEGDSAFKIISKNTVYFYHKRGSGFASLFDVDGNDWISYHPTDKKNGHSGAYRGIPNLWNAGFHPGLIDGKLESTIVSSGPIRARIFSQTEDKKWKCTRDIYPRYATMTLLSKGPKPYWFMYEGTPGGELDLSDYWVLSDGRKLSVEPYHKDHQWGKPLPSPKWVYFGDENISRVLYLVCHNDHDKLDQFWHFGEKTMTVFGFGRGKYGERNWQQLKKVPAIFTIGFSPTNRFQLTTELINDAYRPVNIDMLK